MGSRRNSQDAIAEVLFHGEGYLPPMIMAMLEGRPVWGYELQRLVANNEVDLDRVVDLLKLELYETPSTTAERRRVALREQLRQLNIEFEALVAAHLKAVAHDCLEFVFGSVYTCNISEDQLRKLPVRYRISVPQMWSLKARERIQKAAEMAGMKLVVLFPEPENALAYFMHTVASKKGVLGSQLGVGSKLLIVNIGCGTADLVTYKLEEPLTSTSRLKAVSSSSGGACGSQMINELLLLTVEGSGEVQYVGGLQKTKEKLGFSDLKWRKTILHGVEDIKCRFPNLAKYQHFFRGDTRKNFNFALTPDHLRSAFDRVLGEIKGIMSAEIAEHYPAVIYITGGLGRNRYIFDELCKEYKKNGRIVVRPTDTSGECYPVSNVGLLRYENISPGILPTKYGFAIVQEELYDRHTHPDGVAYVTREPRSKPRRCKDGTIRYHSQTGEVLREHFMVDKHHTKDDVVFASPHDPTKAILLDRLYVLFEKGATIATNNPVVQEIAQLYWLPEEQPMLSATLVYFDGNQRTHDPSGRKGESSTEFGDGIYHLKTIEKTVNKALLSRHGIDLEQNVDGSKSYPVKKPVVEKVREGLARRVGPKKFEKEDIVLWEDDETVWDARFSQFMEEPRVAGGEHDSMEGVEESSAQPGAGYYAFRSNTVHLDAPIPESFKVSSDARLKDPSVFTPTTQDYQKVYDAISQKLLDDDDYDDGSYGP
ncbi:hypothetical protein B0A55_08375, partial [Friedmanniomyces simplex]